MLVVHGTVRRSTQSGRHSHRRRIAGRNRHSHRHSWGLRSEIRMENVRIVAYCPKYEDIGYIEAEMCGGVLGGLLSPCWDETELTSSGLLGTNPAGSVDASTGLYCWGPATRVSALSSLHWSHFGKNQRAALTTAPSSPCVTECS